MDTKRILIAIDDAKASHRAVAYVGQMLSGAPDVQVCLLHVPAPVPPELLEHGGSEDPVEERQIEAHLDHAQATWEDRMQADIQPLFDKAHAILRAAQIPDHAVETHIAASVSGHDLDTCILEAAHTHRCDTVVVGRAAFSWLREKFQEHVADKILRQDDRVTLWVVQ
jgi:nucleotide-binding universal stress UspA family protein